MNQYNRDQIFACYSPKLNAFLQSKGLVAFKKGCHQVTNKQYCLYLQNDRLSQALIEWRETNPNIVSNNA